MSKEIESMVKQFVNAIVFGCLRRSLHTFHISTKIRKINDERKKIEKLLNFVCF